MLLIVATFAFVGCDEDSNDLSKNLTEGKMAMKIGDGAAETLECTYIDYGGEVFITAVTTSGSMVSIMYGDYSNTTPLSVRTYSTATEADKMYVTTSYGYADSYTNSEAVVSVKITKVTDTVIEGELSGKILTSEGNLVTIAAAFKATEVTP